MLGAPDAPGDRGGRARRRPAGARLTVLVDTSPSPYRWTAPGIEDGPRVEGTVTRRGGVWVAQRDDDGRTGVAVDPSTAIGLALQAFRPVRYRSVPVAGLPKYRGGELCRRRRLVSMRSWRESIHGRRCVDCAGALDGRSVSRCSACLAKGAAATEAASGAPAPGAWQGAGGRGRGSAGGPGGGSGRACRRDSVCGTASTPKVASRHAVIEAVMLGGRFALASAIRILDGEARTIDVARLRRAAVHWAQVGTPSHRDRRHGESILAAIARGAPYL